jgi:predicted Zn-dependent protease
MAAAGSVSAGPPGGVAQSFDNPWAMFDQLWGNPTEEQEKMLAQIEVSAARERRIGDQAVRAYLASLESQGIRAVSRGRDVEYLRDLVQIIHPLMRNTQRYPAIKVYLADSPQCEARSFPGGTLVFFQGLLEQAESEAAVVGVVAHELSHLDHGHQLRRVRSVTLAEQTFSGEGGGPSPSRFFTAGAAMLQVWTRPFRPADEIQADRDGARWAYEAGYDPRELATLLLRMYSHHRQNHAPLPDFLRSHPSALKRHDAVMDTYRELQRTAPCKTLYIGKKNLRRRAARSAPAP